MKTLKVRKHFAKSEAKIILREGSDEQDGSFDLVWTTGHKGRRFDWDLGEYDEELEVTEEACDLTRLNNGAAPFLIQHAQHAMAVAGVVTRAWIEDGKGYATIKPSVREDMRELLKDIYAGVLRNISVGYRVITYRDVTNPDDKVRTLRAIKWEPGEISVVAINFDPNAQTSIRSLGAEETNTVEVVMENENQPVVEPTQEPAPTPEPAPAPASAPASEPKEASANADAAIAQERARSASITTAVRAAGFPVDLAHDLISRGVSAEEASAEVFRKLEERNKKQPKTSPQGAQMTVREQVEAALLNRIDAKRFPCDKSNTFYRASFVKLIEGIEPRNPGESDNAFVKRAVVTTATLTELLSNVANKLLGKESAENFSYGKIAAHQTLKDFKETPIILLSGFNLAAKTEGDNYADAALSDSEERITLEERGIIVRISQKAIVNDDLGALKAIPNRASNAGHRDIEKRMHAMLALNSGLGPALKDTKALFHADHANSITVGGLAPTPEGIAQANIVMGAFLDGAGEPMDLRTKVILCGPDLEFVARKTASSAVVPGKATDVNPYAGTLEVAVSSRIPAGVWYAIADKEEFAALVYGTLEGVAEPNVETEVDFNSSNLKTKVEYPNCVGVASHKGIVKITVATPEPEEE